MFRVSFIAPHQRLAAGGVYSIQQFASHLASRMSVSLLVRGEELKPLQGVSVHRAETLSADSVPDADATLLHMNAPDAEAFFALPESKGERLLLFQGYSVLGNEMVKERLGRGLRVLAISNWLVEEARRFGADVAYTPVGLDHSIFFPGPPAADRESVVAVKCHPAKWKGTADGFAALTTVAERRPNARIIVFGVNPPHDPPPFPHTFVALRTQAEVATLFRGSAIFVCPSWEEGFGMPGLEALACGTALATTDTKGSRDYAIDGETALVSPPREPEPLAENILRLLADVALRRRLCRAGIDHAQARFGSWDEAAGRMASVLLSRSPAHTAGSP